MAQKRGILLASTARPSVGNPAAAQKKYDPGVTDNEIKIGNIMPYSGPLSAYALMVDWRMPFQEAQCRGRYQRAKDQFHFLRRQLQPGEDRGAGANSLKATRCCLFSRASARRSQCHSETFNSMRPQLFVANSHQFGDPELPLTMGWQPTYQTEGRIYAKYILRNCPRARSDTLSE